MDRKAFCLLSGGIDSTTCLHKAIIDYRPVNMKIDDLYMIINGELPHADIDWVEAFSIDYGQRHKKEGDYAKKTCESLGIRHQWLKAADFSGPVMLTDAQIEIPNLSYGDIKGVSPTYVPFRNGNLLSLITAKAQQWVNHRITEFSKHEMTDRDTATRLCRDSAGIYFGAHAEDAQNWAYPDCTPEFIGAMANAIYVGTYFCIRLHTPLQWMNKVEIIQLGDSLGVDWENTWSCYKGDVLHCGTCPTCRARKAGFVGAGVDDPTEYAA
jgi:7-cyano-7-deazaguanine synthase